METTIGENILALPPRETTADAKPICNTTCIDVLWIRLNPDREAPRCTLKKQFLRRQNSVHMDEHRVETVANKYGCSGDLFLRMLVDNFNTHDTGCWGSARTVWVAALLAYI